MNVSQELLEQTDRAWTLKVGSAGVLGSIVANVAAAKEMFQTASAVLGFIIAAITLWKLLRGPHKKSKQPSGQSAIIPLLVVGAALLLLSGCTFKGNALSRTLGNLGANRAKLEEESKAMTTGAADSLSYAPSNAPTALALRLLQRDQQIEGMPRMRINVPSVLNGDRVSIAELEERLKGQDKLIAEKDALESKLRIREAELVDLGKRYEEERNKSVVKRIWAWSIGTLGLAGTIALLCFCPALIPVLGHLIGFVVSAFPRLCSAFGVVSKKAFTAVVNGVEQAKDAIPEKAKDELEVQLSKAMDRSHKALVSIVKTKKVAA